MLQYEKNRVVVVCTRCGNSRSMTLRMVSFPTAFGTGNSFVAPMNEFPMSLNRIFEPCVFRTRREDEKKRVWQPFYCQNNLNISCVSQKMGL